MKKVKVTVFCKFCSRTFYRKIQARNPHNITKKEEEQAEKKLCPRCGNEVKYWYEVGWNY